MNASREHIIDLPIPMCWKDDEPGHHKEIRSSGFYQRFNDEYVGSFHYNKGYYLLDVPSDWWNGQNSYQSEASSVKIGKKQERKKFTMPSIWDIQSGDYREPMNKEDEIKVKNYKKIWKNVFIVSLFFVSFVTIMILSLVARI